MDRRASQRSTLSLQRLWQLCASHALPDVKLDDVDQQILDARALPQPPAETRTEASLASTAAAAPPCAAAAAESPPAVEPRRSSRAASSAATLAIAAAEYSTAPADGSTAPAQSRTKPPVSGLGPSKTKRATAASPTRAPSAISKPASRRVLTSPPVAGTQLSPADIAAHGPLYDHHQLP